MVTAPRPVRGVTGLLVVLLVLLLAAHPSSATAAAVGGTAADATIWHITPDGGGSRDGTSWSSAGTLSDLRRFVAHAAPGDEVWIRGDLGPYATSEAVVITAGGHRQAPITVRGVARDGSASARPVFRGTRSDPFRAEGRRGNELFKLLDGADHLRFENMAFANQGNGVFRIGADIADLTISHMTADNVHRFVENYASGDRTSATVDGLHVEDVEVRGFSKSVIRLRYATNGVVIRDVYGDSERQDGHNFAMGVHLIDGVHDVLLERVTMRNSHDSRDADEYWNGDGFVAEPDTHHIVFRDTVATGSTDGGYDLKGTATTLVRARASDNKRNFRFWGHATVLGCLAADPRNRGGTGGRANVWAGASARVRLIGCTYRDDAAEAQLFDVDDTAIVIDVQPSTGRIGPLRVDSTAAVHHVALIDEACPWPATSSFADAATGVHREAIACVAERGIARGTSAHTFAPSAPVSRGQMASFAARTIDLMGGALPEGGSTAFDDVVGTAHQSSIERLAEAGLVAGYGDGSFRPSVPVTRAQLASMIDRAATFVTGAPVHADVVDVFNDDGGVHEQGINRLAHAGIVLGGRTGRFAPGRDVRRDQAASLLARALGVLVTTSP